jgi:hypothetical protein
MQGAIAVINKGTEWCSFCRILDSFLIHDFNNTQRGRAGNETRR